MAKQKSKGGRPKNKNAGVPIAVRVHPNTRAELERRARAQTARLAKTGEPITVTVGDVVRDALDVYLAQEAAA